MKKIGVLTSGGDAPGMNAAIRAVVKTALYHDLKVIGIRRGYSGLIEADFISMDRSSVSYIIQKGGTFLFSARSEEFKTKEGRQKALSNITEQGIEGLIIIGGDGSLRGAEKINEELNIPAVCIPGTIDNDLAGTDYTIGFDTAMNTIVTAINKIRDTASSHERTFIIETMGRTTGFLTMMSGLAGGADAILIPEEDFDLLELCETLLEREKRGLLHNVILMAEGVGGNFKTNRDVNESYAYFVSRKIAEKTGQETRVIILGHLQRGGSPSVMDRIRASQMGAKAVEALINGETSIMVGVEGKQIVYTKINDVLKAKKEMDRELYHLEKILT